MDEASELKNKGFLPQRQKGYYSLRVKVIGGGLGGAQLQALSDIAETYGRDQVHLTVRQSVEIPFLRREDLDEVVRKLAAAGLTPASLGPSLRTMTACPGAEVCPNGLVSPQTLAAALDRELDGSGLPHKFKIGLTGCHNNCLKAEENDIGLRGGLIPLWAVPGCCTHCGRCQKACPAKALIVTKTDLSYDMEKCVHCGRCFNVCPEKCWTGRPGWHMFFGGLFGNDIQTGRSLFPLLTGEPEIIRAITRSLDFFRQYGRKGERFGRTIKRVGWTELEKFMLG